MNESDVGIGVVTTVASAALRRAASMQSFRLKKLLAK
jgi:hypothetical protein